MSAPYRLVELGWVQFERLCAEILGLYAGVEADGWQGRADRLRVANIPEDVEFPRTGALAAPATAVVWWTSQAQLTRGSVWERAALGLAEEATATPLPAALLLLTNVELTTAEVRGLGEAVEASAGRPVELHVLGPSELGALIDGEPVLRRRVPSVLGVRDLEPLVPGELLARSTGDVDAARRLARVFVPTRAYDRARRVLEQHRFAVLTGPPEMGKTAIARMLGLALLTEGWELHECVRPDQLWGLLVRERSQVFVADDAFGSTEYRPDAAERWALELDRVLRAMDERHWLIWTSRPAPLRAALARVHREHGVEHWPQPAEVHVAAADLDVEEKALILFRHARAAEIDDRALAVVRRYGWEIVSHRHFTPERIRRFVSQRLADLARNPLAPPGLQRTIQSEIREPTEAMATSLRSLPSEYRPLLIGLLDVPPGPVPERELAAAARRHAEGLPKAPAELVDRLTDHFLRVVPPLSVTWVHPSWRDLVVDEIAADGEQRRAFLSRCSVDGALLAISLGGGATGERHLPFVVDDADWDVFAGRVHDLASDLDTDGLVRLVQALASTLAADLGAGVNAELEAVAAELHATLARRWNASGEPIPVRLVEALAASRAEFRREPPALPQLRPTWDALRPASWIDVTDAERLIRFDDWLRLAEVLRAVEPDFLAAARFPWAQSDILRMLVADAGKLAYASERPPTGLLLASCLRRLVFVAPEAAGSALGVANALGRSVRVEDTVFAPEAPLERPPDPSPAIVARILRDLER